MLFKLGVSCALAGCLSLAPRVTTAAGLPQTSQAVPTDATLKDRVDHRLETSDAVGKYDVKVKVDNRIVTLSGDVANAGQKAEAARLARVEGVTRVQNDITIDPNEDKTVADRMKSGVSKTGEKITDAWITTK